MEQSRLFLLSTIVALFSWQAVWALSPRYYVPSTSFYTSPRSGPTLLYAKGDPLRESTGIRPSLHPTTINAIAEALKCRARKAEGMNFRPSASVRPIDVALTAGTIAAAAIKKRQETSDKDGMRLTAKEEQTISGRVLGVIMRFDDLESQLHERVTGITWVEKYNEWSNFGVLKSEDDFDLVDEKIKLDPLFAVSRAECLLAIFLETVEIPQLLRVGETVPDGSKIDFLDSDRMEVLLPERSQ